MTHTGCRDDVASGLTKMLWTASQLDDEADFEDLLEAIRVLRPQWPGVGTVAAWRYVRRQAWVDARRVLEDQDEQAKRTGLNAALMAVCLFGLEDPLWHSYARAAAEQRESPEAAKVGFRLLQRAAKSDVSATAEPPTTTGVGLEDNAGFSAPMTWVRA